MQNTQNTEMKYGILLYYCYSPIENPEKFREEHLLLCVELDLRGRIIVAHEGLNGTISGTRENCQKYMEIIKNDPRFADIDFKYEEQDTHAFQKINVRVKPEIVHSGLTHINPRQRTGIHLSAEDFKKLKEEENVVLLDVRSNYEHRVGKFKNAITLDIENFREFPDKVKELQHLKNKKVITYCTGGIKCEKASAFLLENGFEEVYQLHGGIIKYGLEAGGEDFEGKCYVFDNRVVADINTVNPVVISQCVVCQTACDHVVNCANPECNQHAPICDACLEKYQGACSEECSQHPEKRPYNSKGYYTRQQNGYNPLIGWKKKDKTSSMREE